MATFSCARKLGQPGGGAGTIKPRCWLRSSPCFWAECDAAAAPSSPHCLRWWTSSRQQMQHGGFARPEAPQWPAIFSPACDLQIHAFEHLHIQCALLQSAWSVFFHPRQDETSKKEIRQLPRLFDDLDADCLPLSFSSRPTNILSHTNLSKYHSAVPPLGSRGWRASWGK